jgi:hypothetical protein
LLDPIWAKNSLLFRESEGKALPIRISWSPKIQAYGDASAKIVQNARKRGAFPLPFPCAPAAKQSLIDSEDPPGRVSDTTEGENSEAHYCSNQAVQA